MTPTAERRSDIDDALLEAWPRHRLDADNAAYYRGLLDHNLLLNQCGDCGHRHHPPRPICPRCWSRAITPTAVAGTGRIALVTVLRQGRPEPGVDFEEGFAVVAVDLDEQPGLRITGGIIGTPPDQVTLGDRVRVVWSSDEHQPHYADFEIVE